MPLLYVFEGKHWIGNVFSGGIDLLASQAVDRKF